MLAWTLNLRAAKTPLGRDLDQTGRILEMGGKDSIVVAADADLDAAVEESHRFRPSGFRDKNVRRVHERLSTVAFMTRSWRKLRERVARIPIGKPEENVYMGPVINAGAMQSILNYIEVGKQEGRLIAGGKYCAVSSEDGYFIEPTVIADLAPSARLAQEEIFGPVLAVIPAQDFDDALVIANNTDYGLTGAVYTSSPEKVARAERDFFVGNLYINRKCTGAVVGAHLFGGFNMSGTDSAAGGADYLYLFSQAKSIAHRL